MHVKSRRDQEGACRFKSWRNSNIAAPSAEEHTDAVVTEAEDEEVEHGEDGEGGDEGGSNVGDRRSACATGESSTAIVGGGKVTARGANVQTAMTE